ncbi:MAG: hypothetical protein ACJ743_11870 [Gaiellaceae bacterium]
MHGVEVEVRSNRPELLELVARRLRFFARPASSRPAARFELRAADRHFVERPEGRLRSVYEPETGEVVYHEGRDELYIDYGRVRALCRLAEGDVVVSVLEPTAEAAWAATRPLVTLPLLEVLKRHGLYGVHAAGLATGSRGVALPGGSGSGKTTVALALARGGFGFLGDDMLFLSANGEEPLLLAFPDELDITDSTAAFFPGVEGDLRDELGTAKRQLAAERSGGELVPRARPSLLLFPRIGSGAQTSVEPCAADEALRELVPNVLLTDPVSSQRHLDVLGRLARDTRCFRLSLARDLEELPSLVGGLIG